MVHCVPIQARPSLPTKTDKTRESQTATDPSVRHRTVSTRPAMHNVRPKWQKTTRLSKLRRRVTWATCKAAVLVPLCQTQQKQSSAGKKEEKAYDVHRHASARQASADKTRQEKPSQRTRRQWGYWPLSVP